MRRLLGTIVLTCCAILAVPAPAADPPAVVRHDAAIVFDLATHTVTLTDRITLPAAADSFALDRGVVPAVGGDAPPDLAAIAPGAYLGETAALPRPAADTFVVATRAVAHQPTDAVRFSRENVGGEITATVGEEGIWRSGDAAWLPRVEGALHAGTFVIDTPVGWFPVLRGEITAQTEADGRRRTTYVITEPVDGVSLVASTFTVNERDHGGITLRTCLLAPDQRLSDLYLERTAHYLDLYAGLIGPYPYRSFTTVENWFPTGYGMPGWTLLGAQVLRLPFIPYTSFGHEICHNWWGNSVFVDPAGGNWCEGLTVWCADYLYKLEESPEAARQYRRNQLKDYAAYVGDNPDRDFPLVEFKARHSGATRAVGYGKSMAVWHMLEEEIGREAVLQAIRQVYADFRGRPAAWNDFFAALAAISGRDLDGFRRQWLERTGAPRLVLADAARRGDEVRFTLRQDEPPYDLLVPVAVRTGRETIRESVRLQRAEQSYTVRASGAVSVAVDPDNDLFRRLDPAEVEPTLSRVLAAERVVFVPPAAGAIVRTATGAFARAFCECDDPELREDGQPDPAAVNVIVNPDPDVLATRQAAELRVHGDLVFLDGVRYDLREWDLVYAAAAPGGGTDLVIHSRSAPRLEHLGGRLGHYGKYSWLLFPAGGGETIKGNWTPATSPLTAALAP